MNMPRAVAVPVKGLLALLPERVRVRVVVLAEGETFDFSEDLDKDAIAMLHADASTLHMHRGTPLPGAILPQAHTLMGGIAATGRAMHGRVDGAAASQAVANGAGKNSRSGSGGTGTGDGKPVAYCYSLGMLDALKSCLAGPQR